MSDHAVWLVVGLGNPGARYEGNRHNVGEMVVRDLGARHDLGALAVGTLRSRAGRAGPFTAHRTRALVDEVRLGAPGSDRPRLVLAIPTTYMNESGGPVKALM
ncbi:MAG: hypothetical protein ACHP7G_05700, partial [Actinomycetales bacterium]